MLVNMTPFTYYFSDSNTEYKVTNSTEIQSSLLTNKTFSWALRYDISLPIQYWISKKICSGKPLIWSTYTYNKIYIYIFLNVKNVKNANEKVI